MKETWLTKLLQKKFPNQTELQFRLLYIIPIILYLIGSFVLPFIFQKDGFGFGMFFGFCFPGAIYLFAVFMVSFIIKIEHLISFISKYGTTIMLASFILYAYYVSTTLGTENEGGVIYNFWDDIVGSKLPN